MGALLERAVRGLEEIPEEISQAYQKQKKLLEDGLDFRIL